MIEPLNLCFDVFNKYDKVGRIEIRNGELTKNEVYTDDLLLRLYAKAKDAFAIIEMLHFRVMCEERWDEKMLRHYGLEEYNFFDALRATHGVDFDDFFWLRFDGETITYDDVKVRD